MQKRWLVYGLGLLMMLLISYKLIGTVATVVIGLGALFTLHQWRELKKKKDEIWKLPGPESEEYRKLSKQEKKLIDSQREIEKKAYRQLREELSRKDDEIEKGETRLAHLRTQKIRVFKKQHEVLDAKKETEEKQEQERKEILEKELKSLNQRLGELEKEESELRAELYGESKIGQKGNPEDEGGLKRNIKNLKQKIEWLEEKTAREESVVKKYLFRIGLVNACLALLLIFLPVPRFIKAIDITLVGLTLLMLGLSFYEIKPPYIGFLFEKGELIRQLDPGWYFFLPIVWSVDRINTEVQEIKAKWEALYTVQRTRVRLKRAVYFQVVDVFKAIFISKDVVMGKINEVVSSTLRSEAARRTFEDLSVQKGDIERAIQEIVNGDIQRNGYRVMAVPISDIEEEIITKKAEIEILAEADSNAGKIRAIGEEARAKAAEKLKGNYPPAIMALGNFLVKAVTELGKLKEPHKEEERSS